MIIYGWGKKAQEVVIGPTARLVMTYTYVHVFWLLTIAWNRTYQLATWTEHGWALDALTPTQADNLCGGTAPDISAWKRYSLIGALCAFVLLMALALSTSA